jgi:hypothetical protein
VTRLRKMMLEELQRRNYSEITTRKYLQYVTVFARHFGKPPDQLGPDELRSYQADVGQMSYWEKCGAAGRPSHSMSSTFLDREMKHSKVTWISYALPTMRTDAWCTSAPFCAIVPRITSWRAPFSVGSDFRP